MNTWQVLQPGDDPSEGRRINADRATTEGGVLSFLVGDEVVSLFYEWTEAHRVHEWPDRPVGEVDFDALDTPVAPDSEESGATG